MQRYIGFNPAAPGRASLASLSALHRPAALFYRSDHLLFPFVALYCYCCLKFYSLWLTLSMPLSEKHYLINQHLLRNEHDFSLTVPALHSLMSVGRLIESVSFANMNS